MSPGPATGVAPGEVARAAAAGAVKWKDHPRSPPLLIPLDKLHKGWRNQVGQIIERNSVSKQKNSDRRGATPKKTNT